MKGGTYIYKDHPEKDVAKIIFSLVKNPKVTITIVSYESLYGFVFEILIPDEITPFREVGGDGVEYKVTRLIIKFVLLDNTPSGMRRVNLDKLEFDEENVYTKKSVSLDSLIDEAVGQDEIWHNSFVYTNRKPLCNPVIFVGSLNNEVSQSFINQLLKANGNIIKDYIIGQLGKNKSLFGGILVMPHSGQILDAYVDTLHNALLKYPTLKNKILAEVFFVVIQLYIKSQSLLTDGHSLNFMVSVDKKNIDVTIIDLDALFTSKNNDEKAIPNTPEQVIEYMDAIRSEVVEINRKEYTKENMSQMNWYDKLNDKTAIAKLVVELFKERQPESGITVPAGSIKFNYKDVSEVFKAVDSEPAIVTDSTSAPASAPAIVTQSEPLDKLPDNILSKISSLDENQKKQIYAAVVKPYLELLRKYANPTIAGGKKTKRTPNKTKTTRKHR
uniref:Uncharacterized protein n=1 Tax=viral metagenome TaxID=1070528 RepID=A0A6C0F3Q5_9ZZZZ